MWKRWGRRQNFPLAFIDELWKNLKNQNFEKMEKKNIAGDTIILHMCIKSHNHMKYSSWKIKNKKKHLDISSY